jgi:hypothetical protein
MTMPPVTRDEALRIAEDYLKAHRRRNCDGSEEVYTIPELEEFMIRRPCVYGLTPETLRHCWIACAGRPVEYCMVASPSSTYSFTVLSRNAGGYDPPSPSRPGPSPHLLDPLPVHRVTLLARSLLNSSIRSVTLFPAKTALTIWSIGPGGLENTYITFSVNWMTARRSLKCLTRSVCPTRNFN